MEKFDKFNEACGIFGVYAPGMGVARLTSFGLYGVQHRGQESWGISVANGTGVWGTNNIGLLLQTLKEEDLAGLEGHASIGHVRYSTTGSTSKENSQPVHRDHKETSFALAHNGNLINTFNLRQMLKNNGSKFQSTSDSEVIAELISGYSDCSIEDAIYRTMNQLQGVYSLVILTEKELFAVRDPYGIRPLCIGQLGNGNVFSSETCGLDIVGAEYIREVEPGEIIKIDEDGIHSKIFAKEKPSLCIFEFIYFARPDSVLYERSVHHARKHMGAGLAEEASVEADLVIGIPDTGISAAIGYSEKSGIRFDQGLIKNRYIGRTFIQPTQAIRQQGIRLKLNPLRKEIENLRLVVIDDSIVRGNTTKKIIRLLKETGAREVHVRITCPQIKYPCFYGIDTANQEELIASEKNMKEVEEFIGADSLYHLSFEGFVASTRQSREKFCLACFDGVYPIEIPENLRRDKFAFEKEKVI